MTERWRGVGAQYCNVITHYCQNNINIIIVLSGVKFCAFALATIHIVIHKHHSITDRSIWWSKYFIFYISYIKIYLSHAQFSKTDSKPRIKRNILCAKYKPVKIVYYFCLSTVCVSGQRIIFKILLHQYYRWQGDTIINIYKKINSIKIIKIIAT